MTSVAIVQDRLSHEAFVSQESAEVGWPIWRLLWVGWEMGASTSMTEIEATSRSGVLGERFHSLVKTWREECAHLSSIREMVLHPSYQQIVGMGPSAIPFILAELERRPDHWFWALRAITQEDPVSLEHRGHVAEMTRDWLKWAERRGIHR